MQDFDAVQAKFFRPYGTDVPDFGIYMASATEIGFAVGGVKQFGIGSGAGSARLVQTGNLAPTTATQGTDTTPVVTEVYCGEAHFATPRTVTGVSLLNGSAVAGNVWIGLYTAAGALVGSCAGAGVAQAGTAAYQRIPFTAPVRVSNGTHYVAVAFNNVAARFRSHIFGDFGQGKLTGQVFGTAPVAPAFPTTFTPSLGPIASLY